MESWQMTLPMHCSMGETGGGTVYAGQYLVDSIEWHTVLLPCQPRYPKNFHEPGIGWIHLGCMTPCGRSSSGR